MGGASSRTKGHQWEREVAILLRPIYPQARRGLSQTRDGSDVPDVDGTPFFVECKKGKRTNPRAALEQAADAAHTKGDPRPPVAICYDDRERPVAMMYLGDWLDLVGAFHRAVGSKAIPDQAFAPVPTTQAVVLLREALRLLEQPEP